MMDDDEVIYSTSPPLPLEKINRGPGGDAEDHKKARDISLPISEVNRKLSRGDALTRICEVASHSDKTDTNTRKAMLEQIFQLFIELGNQKSANILTDILFDSSLEISTMVLANISVFVAKTDDKDFDAIIYAVAEDLGIAVNEQPASVPNKRYKATQDAAKYLMKNYSSQFIPAIFAPGSIEKGSLKWLAAEYRTIKSETFSDGSEAGGNAEKIFMAALRSASLQLTETIDKAVISIDALNTVVKSIQSVLGVSSDLLRASGEPGIVIVSTTLAPSSRMNQGAQQSQNQAPGAFRREGPTHRHRTSHIRGSTSSQISPTTLTSLTHRFSPEIGVHDNGPPAPVHRQHPETSTCDASGSSYPASPLDRSTPSNTRTDHTSTPEKHNRSSSAPPTPTPAKRTLSQTDVQDNEPKRPRKEEYNSRSPSPTYSPQRKSSVTIGQGGTEPYHGNGGRGYQGKNFIPGFRGRGSFRNRQEFRSNPWRGKQSPWGGRGERSEHQGYTRSGYPHRINYD